MVRKELRLRSGCFRRSEPVTTVATLNFVANSLRKCLPLSLPCCPGQLVPRFFSLLSTVSLSIALFPISLYPSLSPSLTGDGERATSLSLSLPYASPSPSDGVTDGDDDGDGDDADDGDGVRDDDGDAAADDEDDAFS